jgi:hypothetical protein
MTLAGNTVYPYGSIDTNFEPLSFHQTVPLMENLQTIRKVRVVFPVEHGQAGCN